MILKAIVPMKAHSERVPDKNIRLLHNKPLFYWIFNTLNTVPAIQSIILDTDSDVIADHVLKYFPKTEISYRPKELQGDFVSVNSIIENIINNDPLTEYYIQTHSTNPCLKAITIEKALHHLLNYKTYDSVFSVNRLQTRLYDHKFQAINHNPAELIRTQDLKPVYEENSNFYIFTKNSFSVNKTRIGEKPYLYVMDSMESVDIDTEHDFLKAEYYMSTLSKK